MARRSPSRLRDTGPASPGWAFAVWAISTLAAAALVHLLVVFALPGIGSAVQVAELAPPGEEAPRLYPDADGSLSDRFRYSDARADSAFCAFDLRDGAVRIGGELEVPFWSISVHTLSGLVVGSVNHNAASGGRLDLIVMQPALARDLLEAGAVLPADTLIVEMEGPLGLARISGLASYEAQRPALRDALGQTACNLASFEFAPPAPPGADEDGDAPEADGRPEPRVPAPVPRPDIPPR